MSHFYASITSKGTTQTKCGNKDGMYAHIRGWNVGVSVYAMVNSDGEDIICISATSGSNGASSSFIIGDIKLNKKGNVIFKRSKKNG